jgi:hypothetical protein
MSETPGRVDPRIMARLRRQGAAPTPPPPAVTSARTERTVRSNRECPVQGAYVGIGRRVLEGVLYGVGAQLGDIALAHRVGKEPVSYDPGVLPRSLIYIISSDLDFLAERKGWKTPEEAGAGVQAWLDNLINTPNDASRSLTDQPTGTVGQLFLSRQRPSTEGRNPYLRVRLRLAPHPKLQADGDYVRGQADWRLPNSPTTLHLNLGKFSVGPGVGPYEAIDILQPVIDDARTVQLPPELPFSGVEFIPRENTQK